MSNCKYKELMLVIPYDGDKLRANVPHLGIAVISGAAKKAGANIEVKDYRGYPRLKDSINSFVFDVSRKDYDMIGFTISSKNTFEWVESACNNLEKEVLYVAGGPLPTLSPEKILESKVDVCVIGQGQEQIKELIQGRPLSEINGIAYHNGNKLIKNPVANKIQNYVVDKEYIMKGLDGYEIVPIFVGKGCSMNCSFCCVPTLSKEIYGDKFWYREVNDIVNEIKMWNLLGYKKFALVSDNILSSKNFLKEFAEAIEENEIKDVSFLISLRADGIIKHEEELKTLSKVSKLVCEVGFESGSQNLLNFIRKGTTAKQNKKACESLINISATILPDLIMFTHPMASIEDISENAIFYDWLIKKEVEIKPKLYINHVIGLPSTDFFKYLVEEKGCNPNSLSISDYDFDDQKVQELYENIQKPFMFFRDLYQLARSHPKFMKFFQQAQIWVFNLFLKSAKGEKDLAMAKLYAKRIQKQVVKSLYPLVNDNNKKKLEKLLTGD